MDLLQTVRKEGSRGGRSEFKWDDVKNSSHRENYLGHSLMAPVGRWQQGRDLNWYANHKDANGNVMSEDDARKEEIRRVKEAEEAALAKALGIEPPQTAANNANLTALGGAEGVSRIAVEKDDGSDEGARERRQRRDRGDRRRRSRSRDEQRERHSRRHRRHRRTRSYSRSRSRSRSRDRREYKDEHRRRSDRPRREDRDDRHGYRKRSRSPTRRYDDRDTRR